MSEIDYSGILAGATETTAAAKAANLFQLLPEMWAESYRSATPRMTDICIIPFEPFHYIYDDYATLEAQGKVPPGQEHEPRIVAVLGYSSPKVTPRDDHRLKGWVGPTEWHFGKGWDKGHFIAHSIGGAVDQSELNVFVQSRRLNRGWSDAGKRFRQMEKYCFDYPATFCFHRPIYADGSAKPAILEFGVLKTDGELWVERFDNT